MDFEQTKAGILVPANFADTRRRPEMHEVATTRDGRDITRGYVDPFRLQQPDDSVLQLRGAGDYHIYKELLRDDQVGATFAQRRLAVVAKELQVDAGGTSRADKKAADFLKEQIDSIGFDRITDKMLYGRFYGFAVSEVMWGRDSNYITIADIKVRDRRRFGFDGFGNLRMKTFAEPDGELLPDRKFWSYSTGADHDDEPYGLGLAHWLYWPVFFKRAGIEYWMVFLERFGQPTAVGKHPSTATPHEKQTLLDALEAIATDTGVTVPLGMEISFLEAARSGTADYSKLCEHMDNAIAKIVLGQTASTQGSPGKLGNDELQGDVRNDLIRADADLVCESFNRSIGKWLTEYNFPGANLPRVYRVTDPAEDINKLAERDTKIHAMGYKPTLKHIEDNYGGEWEATGNTPPILPTPEKEANPTAEDSTPSVDLESVQQAALNGAQIKSLSDVIALVQAGTLDKIRARALVEVGFPAISPQQISRLLGDVTGAQFADSVGKAEQSPAEQMLEAARAQVEPASNTWINKIKALGESAQSLEQLREELLNAYPEMTLDEYADAMTAVTTAATLAGRNAVTEERQ